MRTKLLGTVCVRDEKRIGKETVGMGREEGPKGVCKKLCMCHLGIVFQRKQGQML